MAFTPNKKPKSPIELGDWFAAPLRTGGYGVGVVARKGRKGILFGYFFGPRSACVPGLVELQELRAVDAILVRQFGHLGLLERKWPVIGRLENWRMEDWPLSEFGRVDESLGKAWRVRYPDDLSGLGEETPCSIEAAKALPCDALAGDGAIEILLTDVMERAESGR
ncbi:Imm26 family immunity protein [Archangium sp.]|uniref:Imm26 family immunity protein n=1 Tax=Archangium sp. TaxID=1872627 RepID=UPI00286B9041|nr:Imm26 family immunity protein [Archangium sp.]